ncbi:MAG TPA: helix-turn-helix domain-containing protein [Pyrinomonadaceae bacterium]|nr:helix-turn-helix domain-containing protein [Pyrinomonadaceae bacterium]
MHLQTSIYRETKNPNLDTLVSLCELAKELEDAGEFELAEETLRPFWKGIPNRPNTTGIEVRDKAELLLRAGTLTGWLGSAKQLPGSQEVAKDLISESATIFESFGLTDKLAEARVNLAVCYWREGGLDEARVNLRLVLDSLKESQSEQRLRALLTSAIVEAAATRHRTALLIYKQSAPLFHSSSNHSLKGRFHTSYATLLRSLGSSENREEYIDLALLEYTAAGYHFEQAGHRRFQGRVENNVGFLFATLGKFADAQQHLSCARMLLLSVGDHGGVAGVDDSRAQAFLLEGKYELAAAAARLAVRALRQGGEQARLSEALTTYGKALARLNRLSVARGALDQAIETAHQAGHPDGGGVAAVTVIEELSSYLSVTNLQEYYRTAEMLLAHSQEQLLKTRLGECARRVLMAELDSAKASTERLTNAHMSMPPGFSLDAEVLRYEGSLIRKALEDSGGSVTRAARLLGVTHQGLAFILNGRHSDLLSIRTPVKKRRRSIIRDH